MTKSLNNGARRVGVMQVTDTLDAGGMERVAVNLANALPRELYRSHLCTTRRDGSLSRLVAEDVGRLRLQRRGRIDVGALRRLAHYIEEHDIKILHAHGSALFAARAATLLSRNAVLIWHDHYGRYLEHERSAWLYRAATRGVGGVIAVNEPLAAWSRDKLGVPASRVWYVPNFVAPVQASVPLTDLPGEAGSRIVCVANLRPQKDHLNLLRAMRIVRRVVPRAHLLLVGGVGDRAYETRVRQEVAQCELTAHISFLGERQDVSAILRACDVGVLASTSEGLPLALLEYGMASLPVVATDVGQCAEVLDAGCAGLIVPPAAPKQLASALLKLLCAPIEAAEMGQRLRARTETHYRERVVIEKLTRIYEAVLAVNSSVARQQGEKQLRVVG